MTNISPETHTATSGRCGCASHGGDAVEKHPDRHQRSTEHGCCGGSADRGRPAREHAHAAYRHQATKGAGCCGGSHAETVPDSPDHPSRG